MHAPLVPLLKHDQRKKKFVVLPAARQVIVEIGRNDALIEEASLAESLWTENSTGVFCEVGAQPGRHRRFEPLFSMVHDF